jgi:hypothetical protein
LRKRFALFSINWPPFSSDKFYLKLGNWKEFKIHYQFVMSYQNRFWWLEFILNGMEQWFLWSLCTFTFQFHTWVKWGLVFQEHSLIENLFFPNYISNSSSTIISSWNNKLS